LLKKQEKSERRNTMLNEYSHKRFNPLTGEWILVSPHRAKRPWQGKVENLPSAARLQYDPACYLCPGNKRANGSINPHYTATFSFENDFAALQKDVEKTSVNEKELLVAETETGICHVICFSPRHDLTLAELEFEDVVSVVKKWQEEYKSLGSLPDINHVQIFENKGEIMGCSNPHPHGQVWAQESIPVESAKEYIQQQVYFKKHGRLLLQDYMQIEMEKDERVVYENSSFVLVVPFWACWPFETMILPKRVINNILQLTEKEVHDYADILKVLTVKYDNIFKTPFPYSAGIHQAPTDGRAHEEIQMHMHFYPPLLRSASVKKFMVGYEMMANPQRDITPEKGAEVLKNSSTIHYKLEE
jgi:UDPglucose--hexose-1-phosphate uridylyltransferase